MIKTKRWNILDHLKSEKDIKRYLDAAFEEGDPVLIAAALGDVAKARKVMSRAAKRAGIARESIYQSLSKKGKPQFSTILSVINSLGYQLTVIPHKKVS